MTKQAVISEFYETMRNKNIDYLKVIDILLINMTEARIRMATKQLEKSK